MQAWGNDGNANQWTLDNKLIIIMKFFGIVLNQALSWEFLLDYIDLNFFLKLYLERQLSSLLS